MTDSTPTKRYPSLSVVTPVYNGESTIATLVSRIQATLEPMVEAFEVILVNDGSQDGSWGEICRLTERHSFVYGVNLTRNYGQHNALLAGIRRAKHEVLVTIDDDLQNPPEEIPKLLEELAEGYDVVYGVPERGEHGLCRNLASRLTKIALRSAMGVKAARNVSAFRAFRTDLRAAFLNFRAHRVCIDVLLAWGASSFSSVTVKHEPRKEGRSNYTFRKLVSHALNMLTGFSALPLRLASLLGFFFTAFGFGIFLYVLWVYFTVDEGVPGFPFLAAIIAIFAGVQLFTLGIIGEYVGRMHQRLLDRPTYLTREEVGGHSGAEAKAARETSAASSPENRSSD